MGNLFNRWLLCFALWILMLNPASGQTVSRIVYGDGVREMLAMGRVGQYEFNGRSGDVVTVRLLRVSGSWDPAMVILGADGRLLERQTGNRIQVDRTLSQDGVYSVLVSDVGEDESGLYSLALETLNGPAQFHKQVVNGSVVTDTLQFEGDLAGFSFEGFPGDAVMLRATVLGGVDQEMELFGPDGKRMEKDNPGFFSTTPTLRITRQLDLTGIYKVVISDPDLQGPTDFTFSYALIARAGVGTRTMGSVDVEYGDAFVNGFALGEIDQFVFEARAGDVVNCRATAIHGSVDPVMEVYDPDGVSVAKGGGGVFASGQVQVNYTVLRDGPHKVVVKESRLDQAGDYGFVIERLDGGALHDPVILDGNAEVGSLRFLGDVKAYRVEAQQGDTIAVRVASIRGNLEPVVELFDANGMLVDKAGGGRGASANVQLRTAFGDGGRYKILVSDSNADDVGEFTVTLSVVPLAVPQLPLPGLFGLPSIELINPVVSVVSGQPVVITSRMTDNQGIRRAMLFYRAGGQADFDSLRLGTTDGLTYAGSIPQTVVSSRGVEYYLKAVDEFGNVRELFAEDTRRQPFVSRVAVSGLQAPSVISGGMAQTAFRMVSFPLDLADNTDIGALLEQELGAYDRKIWRMFRFSPSGNRYEEYPAFRTIAVGQAVWVIARDGVRIRSGSGMSTDSSADFEIVLEPGWNDFGNPFHFPVSWADVKVDSEAALSGPFTYRGRWQSPSEVPVLEPWEGYTIWNPSGQRTVLRVPAREANRRAGKVQAHGLPEGAWQIRIVAQVEDAVDAINRIGQIPGASEGWDRYDVPEPPPVGDYVSLVFPKKEWIRYAGDYTADYRPMGTDGVWTFEVRTPIERSTVQLSFQDLEHLPGGYGVVLFDLDTREEVDLTSQSRYTFPSGGGKIHRRFQLVVGTPDEVDLLRENLNPVPRAFSLFQNHPNPFNPETTIQYQLPIESDVQLAVYTVRGQEVKTLVAAHQQAGAYRVIWDGTDALGRSVASGVYFYRLQADGFSEVRKMLMVK